ncbi:MAG: hypothetical protein WA160_12690 [Pseudobdellovibrio sp.]
MLMKLLVTGSIGATFNFYFFVLWVPVVTLSFSLFRGQKSAAFTSALFVGAFIIAFVSYPNDPPMDFRRQIVSQLEMWIILATLVSLGFQIIFSRLKSKNI